MNDILPSDLLNSARRLQVTTLESGVLFNNGKARFTFSPLPRVAQVAPGFGVVAAELDGDGRPEIYFVQNFFSPDPETGRMDGGLSQLLQRESTGNFGPVESKVSGLVVSGDAKALALTDLNGDGRPDLLVGVNDGDLVMLTNATPVSQRVFSVRLTGPPGNPTGIGASVSVILSNGSRQCDEVRAGGSYLSQSTSDLFFGLGATNEVRQVQVRWPDGALTTTNALPESLKATARR